MEEEIKQASLVTQEGRDKQSGKFLKGNSLGGRTHGSRNELTKRMLERFALRNEDGISVEEILFDIMQDPKTIPDLKLKAASKLADLVYPKAQSVELEIESFDNMSPEELDDRIVKLLANAEKKNNKLEKAEE